MRVDSPVGARSEERALGTHCVCSGINLTYTTLLSTTTSLESVSDLSTAIATTDLKFPNNIALANDFQSLRNERKDRNTPTSIIGYKGVDWRRIPGYRLPPDDFERKDDSWQLK